MSDAASVPAPASVVLPTHAEAPARPRRERDVRLDVLKAIAILLVILGHAITLVYGAATRAPVWMGTIFSVVAAVNVPLFMFVSGYLTRSAPSLRWVGQRATRLLVPYAAWSVLVFVASYRAAGWTWFIRPLWIPQNQNGLWFLYVLFEFCVIWAIVSRDKWVMWAAVAACFLLPVDTLLAPYARYFGLWIMCSQFPIFAAGHVVATRGRFEPKWWVLPLAVVLMAVMWTVPGFNPMYAIPQWSVRLAAQLGTAGWAIDPVRVLVRVGRAALELSLVASAFWLVQKVRHGAWIGALTLGIYASHQFFMARWLERSGHALDVLVVFGIASVGAVGTALLLDRWQTTRFLLLGGGKLPGWVGRRKRAEARPPA
jgi:fucose 4-O-acetylase-like acetyltransferase